MNINLSTFVSEDVPTVFSKFNADLFTDLAPPFPPVKLVRYDGEKTGDVVTIELNFLLFKQQWVSTITEHYESVDHSYFIDEGTKLPFFLRKWKHIHTIKKQDNHTVGNDNIYYETPFFLLNYLIYPFLLLQFLYRKPIYRRLFGKINS